jgi:MGT family glycosyltransferase
MAEKKKVMVLVPSALGHVNPICGLIYELCKNKNIEVLFYSDEPYRKIIEKTGAKFRLNEKLTYSKIDHTKVTKMGIGDILDVFIGFAYDQLPQYISEVEKEKPDLILYDGLGFTAKYLIEVIKTRLANGDTTIQLPKFASFSPNFPINEHMMKSVKEKRKTDIWAVLSIANAFRKQFVFSWYFGISVYNPLGLFLRLDDTLNIVGVNPELQPYREEFNDTFKFVGSCISEETRSVDIIEDLELKELLGQFDKKPSNFKLIFMSLGSSFNANYIVYEKAIEAFQKFDESSRCFKSSQFKTIISLGESLNKLNEKISNGELTLPKNILLRAKVPQLEVLKRADLFITHCGMNSTLETIKYSVPIIGLPFDGDQPANAKRICDELSFGVRLETLEFTPNQLADSIDQVMSDAKFKDNIERMSKISENYNGAVKGAEILTDYLYQ